MSLGVHRFLDTGRRGLSTKQRQSEESKNKGLPGKGQVDCCRGPREHVHRLCRLRGQS